MHCLFCNEVETIDHLFFLCVSSKYTWSLVASVLGASHRPISFGQFWQWASVLLPNRKHFHIIGLAAICWALWTTRNDSCFEKKAIRSPTEVVCSASSFIKYWAGLQTGQNKEELDCPHWGTLNVPPVRGYRERSCSGLLNRSLNPCGNARTRQI